MSHLPDNSFFSNEIMYLKGGGQFRAEVLQQELGIKTFGDLLTHYPYRYVDRSKFYKIKEITEDMPYIQLRGIIKTVTAGGGKRTTKLIASFKDDTGIIDLLWFQGIKWMRDYVKAGVEYVVFGKPTVFNGQFNIVHPELETVESYNENIFSPMQAMYNTTEKCKAKNIDSKTIWKMQRQVVQMMPSILKETLPQNVLNELKLMSLRDSLVHVHMPSDSNTLQSARFRLKFDELFYIQLRLLKLKLIRTEKSRSFLFSRVGEQFNDFYNHHLPFELTGAQKRVIKEIRNDTVTGHQMNRLLQGDVGSGKTLVAVMCMLLAIDNGFQCALMAPTEILSQQHFATISDLLKNLPVKVALLTGSTKSKKRRETLQALADNEIKIIIGTHALIEDEVQFNNLGLVVIDEQHRFGVAQRARLWQKNPESLPPHVLVMTATPIPRTLSMTLYGDLDVSVIDEMPPGRKAINTTHRFEKDRYRIFNFMKEEISKGRQIYIVYPLIEESEKLDYMNLMAGYDAVERDFPPPQYRVSMVHGRQKTADREFEMQRFVEGKTQIMIATTVIEVGVNVPNASVMMIESAQRFGLSQLHQLRGRVGRGADQSYCILMTDYKLSNEAKTRIETMCRTNDGFEISEVDMQLRGPGDIEGTQQSGLMDLHIADITKDAGILELARMAAQKILKTDPQIVSMENSCIKNILDKIAKQRGDWSKVS